MGKMHEYDMFNWGYHTEPEPNLNGRKIEAMRGKVLGGSSSINVMAYTRGHRGDYDRWAQKGARGWSHAEVLPYFRRSERRMADTAHADDDTFRGKEGNQRAVDPAREDVRLERVDQHEQRRAQRGIGDADRRDAA